MNEKFKFWLKTFAIGLLGCLAGGVFIVLIHYFLEFTGGVIYLLPGIVAVIFYLNFINKEERTLGSHISVDVSLLVGTLIVQMVDFAICYADEFTVPDKPMGAIGKTFYRFFSVGGINLYKIQEGSVGLPTEAGKFEIWTLYITYVLCAIIGAYIVFGCVKLNSVMFPEGKKADRKAKKNKKK
ncbi:MAG: hypothetical protein IJZ94_05725 [Clostridia bacterium]|nr:hypothetical protein [Clostridia bacterium]